MSYTLWDSVGGHRGMVLALFAALLLGGACTKSSLIQGRCNRSSDCTNGLVCDDLETCVPATASSSPCSQTAQCGSDYSCDDLGWCVCANKGATGGNVCANGSSVIYRGVETDGGMPDGAAGAAGAAGSGGTGGKGDGGTGVGGSGGFVCHANTDCPVAGKGVCADGGVCVGCTTDSDCTAVTSPICDTATNTCVPCTTDAQCVAKLGTTGNPGVCMFQTDGHCATDTETVYVHFNPVSSMCPAPSASGAGAVNDPFCDIADAVVAAGTRSLLVLLGGSIPGGATIQNSASLSLVGQQAAALSVASGDPGLHVTNATVYIRDLAIGPAKNATATIGIIADGNATIRLDGLDIEGMPQGGLRVTASEYDVVNSIFAGNGGTQDEVGRLIGGAYLSPASGATSRFAFNTIVYNKETGVVCGGSSQTIDASLLAGNGAADSNGCTLAATSKALGTGDPMLNSTYREAGLGSPCVDFVKTPPAGAPNHDIDLTTRPQGAAFDCGASEFPQ